jgi:protein phosphatase 2C family protein 2/3
MRNLQEPQVFGEQNVGNKDQMAVERKLRSQAFTAYSARTSKGLYRNYNEDRVSVIANILLEDSRSNLPSHQKSSFFGLFDGHAGSACVDFIKDNLHQYITSDENYLSDKKLAIKNGIFECEKEWMKIARGVRKSDINLNFINQLKLSEPQYDLESDVKKKVGRQMWDQYNHFNMYGIDISGSCLTLSLFCEDKCYLANLGDSRIIMSKNSGEHIQQLTTDHKPETAIERARIEQNGGEVFRNRSRKMKYRLNKTTGKMEKFEKVRCGPHRVNPGGLSLSRSIGDLPSKAREVGGNPNCLISCPEITEVDIDKDCDFMILACDGVWDELSN